MVPCLRLLSQEKFLKSALKYTLPPVSETSAGEDCPAQSTHSLPTSQRAAGEVLPGMDFPNTLFTKNGTDRMSGTGVQNAGKQARVFGTLVPL